MESNNSSQSSPDFNTHRLLALIYKEKNFSRTAGTVVAGVIGVLTVHFFNFSYVIFSAIIAFSLTRLMASAIHSHVAILIQNHRHKRIYLSLPVEDKRAISVFLNGGSNVILLSQLSSNDCSVTAIESLRHRKLIKWSISSVGKRERTLVLDLDLFTYLGGRPGIWRNNRKK